VPTIFFNNLRQVFQNFLLRIWVNKGPTPQIA